MIMSFSDIGNCFGLDFSALQVKSDIKLTPEQEQVLRELKDFTLFSNKRLFALNGIAGSGKSTLLIAFIQWLESENKEDYISVSPTNKACKNLRTKAQKVGLNIQTKTVASLLQQKPKLNKVTGLEEFLCASTVDLSDYSLVLLDEYSMLCESDFETLLDKARMHDLKIILVGDRDQLPPVGESQSVVATSSLIDCRSDLNTVVRYEGQLAQVVEEIRTGRDGYYKFSDGEGIKVQNFNAWVEQATYLIRSQDFAKNSDYARILAWRNKTVDSWNRLMRQQLWGNNCEQFLPGDRLIAKKPLFRHGGGDEWRIIVENSEELVVIDSQVKKTQVLGQEYYYYEVKAKSEEPKPQLTLFVIHEFSAEKLQQHCTDLKNHKQWKDYGDLRKVFDSIGYSYCLTVHKSQGSTISNTLLDIGDINASRYQRRQLAYTALSRTSEKAYILAS